MDLRDPLKMNQNTNFEIFGMSWKIHGSFYGLCIAKKDPWIFRDMLNIFKVIFYLTLYIITNSLIMIWCFVRSTKVPESSVKTRNEIATLHSSSEVSLSTSTSLFLSYRFFVELGGLSTSEKLKLLNGIQAVEYDRTKSLKLITQCRKIRSFGFMLNLLDSFIGTRRWLLRSLLPLIRSWSFQRNRKAVARFIYRSFILLRSSVGRTSTESGKPWSNRSARLISRYSIRFNLNLVLGAPVGFVSRARRFNETQSELETK